MWRPSCGSLKIKTYWSGQPTNVSIRLTRKTGFWSKLRHFIRRIAIIGKYVKIDNEQTCYHILNVSWKLVHEAQEIYERIQNALVDKLIVLEFNYDDVQQRDFDERLWNLNHQIKHLLIFCVHLIYFYHLLKPIRQLFKHGVKSHLVVNSNDQLSQVLLLGVFLYYIEIDVGEMYKVLNK